MPTNIDFVGKRDFPVAYWRRHFFKKKRFAESVKASVIKLPRWKSTISENVNEPSTCQHTQERPVPGGGEGTKHVTTACAEENNRGGETSYD